MSGLLPVWKIKEMSISYLKKGELDKAEQEAEKALQISKDINSVKENAIAQRMLGRVHHKAGDVDESINRLEKSKDKLRKSGFIVELAKTLMYLGRFFKENDENKSKKYLREAGDRLKKSGMKPWLDIIDE